MNVRRDRTLFAILALTAVSIVLRVAFLGSRVAHWDEARVAYWIFEYGATGVVFYRPIIHGPLLHLVNAPLFDLLGATDFAMRLFPAVVGALLPLSVLLLRHRLRDETAVALALLFALDPILLYYSRFMRNDILTAVFAFVAFACLVRAIDFDDGRYLLAAAVLVGVAFGAKENALAYLFAWVGAAGLLLLHRPIFAHLSDGTPKAALLDPFRRGVSAVSRHVRGIAASVGLFVLTIVVVYAPRGELPSQELYYTSCVGYGGYFDVAAAPTLGEALANPLLLPRLVAFTVGSTAELYGCQWIFPRTDDPNPYVEFLSEMTLTTVEVSTALVVLAVVGYLIAAYGTDLPDDLVSFSFYWGVASMVGYPLITDIGGSSWLLVHVVVPLAIPAAFALGTLLRWGWEAHLDDDTVSVAMTSLLVVIVVGSMLWVGYASSFQQPQSPDNQLVQFAQPSGDLKPTLAEMRTLADENDGVDVVLYGDHLNSPSTDEELQRRPTCSQWFNSLPLPWYFESGGIAADCAPDTDSLEEHLADDPPIVIVHADEREAVDERIDDRYDDRVHLMRSTSSPFVFYVDESRLP